MNTVSRARIAVPVIAAVVALALASPDGVSQERGRVTGSVVSTIVTGSAEAVPGVTVRFPELGLGTVMDRRGRFQFSSVPAGSHELRAEVIGCELETRVVQVKRDERAEVDFTFHQPAIQLQGVVVTGATSSVSEAVFPFAVGVLDPCAADHR